MGEGRSTGSEAGTWAGLGVDSRISQTHSHSLSDVDPGAHNVISRHGLEGG